MKNMVIARRYAKALLLIGKDDGQAESYREELGNIAGLVTGEKELEQAITNPLYNVADRRKVLYTIIDKTSLSDMMKAFLLLVFDKGRIGFLSNINGFYKKLADELKGIARASLVSATELSSETIDKIRSTMSEMTGKDVILGVEQDPSLIGGVISRIGDLVLDGSIRTQLLNMRESIKRGESV